ncbi:metal ABC transporter permease [Shinella sp. M31]|uniref:metal ABC transporter permease n=1 Tax=Shinella sp. M31 TaxID=3368615 RepID=UPI003BA24A7A
MNETLELALLPFQLAFMQNAFLVTLTIAVPMALLSCYLVLKGWSLMGDAVSHAVLPGVVIAYVVGLPFAAGAFVAGLTCALAAGYLKDNSRVKEDTVLGIVFSGMFALGLVLYVKIQPDIHLDHILFGDMLGIAASDLIETGVIAIASTGFILIFRKDLLVHAFDRQHASAIGLPVNLLHYGLLAVLSLVVVGALKAVGIILAIAMLVAPGAIAALLTRRFPSMLLVAVGVAVGASFFGIWLSFIIDSAPAPTIVLLMSILFVLAFLRQMLQNRKPGAEAGQQATMSSQASDQ